MSSCADASELAFLVLLVLTTAHLPPRSSGSSDAMPKVQRLAQERLLRGPLCVVVPTALIDFRLESKAYLLPLVNRIYHLHAMVSASLRLFLAVNSRKILAMSRQYSGPPKRWLSVRIGPDAQQRILMPQIHCKASALHGVRKSNAFVVEDLRSLRKPPVGRVVPLFSLQADASCSQCCQHG